MRLTPRVAIAWVFFANGALMASWVSRIPAISHRVGADTAALGLALLAPALASIVTVPLMGHVLPGRSSRTFCLAGFAMLMAAIVMPALAHSVPVLGCVLFIFGVANSIIDMAMNTQGVSIEHQLQRPLLASLHATWSFGGFAGAGLGSIAAAANIAPLPHLIVASLLFGLPALIVMRGLLPQEKEFDADNQEPSLAWTRLPRRLLLIGAAAFFSFVAEGASADWSAKLVHDDLGGSAATGAIAYAAFNGTMATGRLFADRLWAKWGAIRLLRRGGAFAAVGFGTGLAIGTSLSAIIGFAALGIGLSGVIPTLFRASTSQPGVPGSSALAAVAAFGYVGFLLGPPVIGGIAQLTSLHAACILLVFAAVVVVIFAPATRAQADTPGEPVPPPA